MAYIGNIPAEAYISISSQTFTTINGTVYTLSTTVTTSDDIALFLNNVRQKPSTYTASGTTLTMGTATTTADELYCVFLGKGIQTVNPPAGSVGTSQLTDDAVTAAKIATDAVETAEIKDLNVTNAKIAAGTIDVTAKITGVVPTANLGSGTASSSTILYGDQTYKTEPVAYDDNVLQSNVAMLGFKVATNGSLVRYNLVDQSVDEFFDTSGVDASASIGESRSLASPYYYYGGSAASNYYGDDSDGALSTSGNVTYTVPNKNGSYDGDMVLKQYSSLTINSGDTITTDQPCRGMLIYVTGNCSIAGTLTMSARGGDANPTSSTASSDGNVVNAAGLQMGLYTATGTSSHTNSLTSFNGYGTAVRTAFNNQSDPSSNGEVFTITRTGGAAIRTAGAGNQNGATGTAGTLSGTSMGTGAGGAGGFGSITGGDGPYSGAGGAFGGGSGATGLRSNTSATGLAADQIYGNAGSTAASSGSCASGGTGNPGGAGVNGGETGTSGTGGIIILIVGGTLTITGTVSANGVAAVSGTNCAIGGASGGGAVMLLHKGTLSNSGSVTATGGAASTASAFGDGGAGGAGTTQIVELADAITEGVDMTLQSTDVTAVSEPSYGEFVTLIENNEGTAVLNTDIKGFISRDSGVTFTQGTLVDEGSWGVNKKILGFHDLDISAQPSGTSMCYKITTHNQSAGSKETRVYATSIGWR